MVELRATFDTVAEQYDRARPRYPDELVDDLVREAGLSPGSRVLEVACGTGQLTRALVERGLHVTCVEMGSNMAAVARRQVPEARIVESSFEAWEPDGTYDAVCCATAWHWLDAAAATEKAHRVLRDGGHLAVVGTHHVVPADGDSFFHDIQRAYEAIGEGAGALPTVDDIRHDDAVAIRATGLFDVADHLHLRVIEYDAESYIDVLGTYSGHLAMSDDDRQVIFDAVREIAGDRLIRKHHLFCLHLARKVS